MRWVGDACLLDGFDGPLKFSSRVMKPVRTPDPVDGPTPVFEHSLAQPVTVSGRAGAMITRAVTLDTQTVASRLVWIDNTQVDPVTRHPHLRMHFETLFG